MYRFELFPELLLEKDCHPEVSAYYFKEWEGFEMVSFHTHDALEIMYVMDGICRVELRTTAEEEITEVTLKKGEFILIGAHMPHRLVVPGTCRMLNIEFRFIDTGRRLPSMKQLAEQEESLAALFSNSSPFIVLRELHNIHLVFKNLVYELDTSKTGFEPMPQLLLSQLLIIIARLYQENLIESRSPQGMYVQQCIDYLHQNYDRNILIKDIAESVSLHPGYLQRVFKLKMGISIMEYLNVFRIEKIKMLLRQTEIPIADIADYVGIGSRQYLHMIFKKHTGLTPVEYRNISKPAGEFRFEK
ncbi:AraC-like DNA-binding protein [Paenibacillus sp. DS2015]|uniref:AraC family transcriptional regulator n=1 Tax=Paenibacillus sp. DS2015 TaxID=3373917 RepID=UPI003D19AEB8